MSTETPNPADHWDTVYQAGDTGKSWYQQHATASVALIQESIGTPAGLIDIGGGASTLVDDLLEAGWDDLTVLDISETGLRIARERLGDSSREVTWIAGSVLDWAPARTYDVWHDRAVLHFLTGPQAQQYRDTLRRATRPGSTIIIGVFGPDGPARCSGLPVQRYGAADLGAFLGPDFKLLADSLEVHVTPAAVEQQFQWICAVRLR